MRNDIKPAGTQSGSPPAPRYGESRVGTPAQANQQLPNKTSSGQDTSPPRQARSRFPWWSRLLGARYSWSWSR